MRIPLSIFDGITGQMAILCRISIVRWVIVIEFPLITTVLTSDAVFTHEPFLFADYY